MPMPDVDLTTVTLTDLNAVDLTGQQLPSDTGDTGDTGDMGDTGGQGDLPDGDTNWLDVLAIVVEAEAVNVDERFEIGRATVSITYSTDSREVQVGVPWGRWVKDSVPIHHKAGDISTPTQLRARLPELWIESSGSVTLSVSLASRTQGSIALLRQEGITEPADFTIPLDGLLGVKPVSRVNIDAAITRTGHPIGLNLPGYVPPPPPPPPRPPRPYTPPAPPAPNLSPATGQGVFYPVEQVLGGSDGVPLQGGRVVYGEVCERNRLTGVLQCRQQIVGIIV